MSQYVIGLQVRSPHAQLHCPMSHPIFSISCESFAKHELLLCRAYQRHRSNDVNEIRSHSD